MKCRECQRETGRDESGLTKKLINRACPYVLCYHCLAKQFRTTEDELQKMARAFRESGCLLFQ